MQSQTYAFTGTFEKVQFHSGMAQGTRLEDNTFAQGAKVFLPSLSGVLAFLAFPKVLR